MSEYTASTGKLIIFILIGVTIFSTICYLSVLNAKVDTGVCQVEDGILGNFQPKKNKSRAPDTVFFDSAGNKKRLTDLNGRGIILNFWASWCAPCVREMPQLNRLKGLLEDNGIEVLAVSEDREGASLVKNFLKKNKLYNLDALIDREGKLIKAVKALGLPTTIIFDRDGQELGRVIGVADWDSPKVVKFIRMCLGN